MADAKPKVKVDALTGLPCFKSEAGKTASKPQSCHDALYILMGNGLAPKSGFDLVRSLFSGRLNCGGFLVCWDAISQPVAPCRGMCYITV